MSADASGPYPPGLTARARGVVNVVRFRNAPPGGPCYALPGERGTVDLYVPCMYGEKPEGLLHERLWTLRQKTLKACIDSGAVSIGPAQASDNLRGLPARRVVAPLTVGPWREPSGSARSESS